MNTLFVPYRVNLLGAHIDHQKGITASICIDKGIVINYKPSNISKITSVNYNETKIGNDIIKENTWFDYYKGCLKFLNVNTYIEATIKGQFPIGGLSSSSAVIIAYLLALIDVNKLYISNKELVDLAYKVEHDYIGVNIGKLDPITIIYGKKDNILIYDHFYNTKQYIPFNYQLYIIHSGLERNLVNSNYNNRINEIHSAISKYNKVHNTFYQYLREIDNFDVQLPDNEYKRITHFYTELERVKHFNDFNIKDLINQSCQSSIVNYESGCIQLIDLYNNLKNYTNGIRFNGAGFKGSLYYIDDNQQDKINNYLNQYENKYNLKTTISKVNSVNGVTREE